MRSVSLGLIVLFVACVPLAARAEEKPVVPRQVEKATVVSAEECEQLVKAKTLVFDVRNEVEYEAGHIPGAINIPYREKSQKSVNFDGNADSFNTKMLPKDKNTQIVIYCNGETCWKSYKASTTAVKAGYRKVVWFRGGMPEWEGKGFPVEK